MKKITSKKLANYGAMSAAILATAAASGQITYTAGDGVVNDADDGVNIDIDLNQDALIDYTIQLSVVGGGVSYTITPDAANNVDGAFVGMAAGGFQYPALMALDDLIDASVGATDAGARGDLNYYGCAYSNSEFCGDITDGYVGLVFDLAGATHYGWLQLDSSIAPGPGTAAGTYTVKGYAFNTVADEAINAGQQSLGIENQIFNNFEYFTSNNVLTMKAASAMESVVIFNINGQEVLNRTLSSTTESIDLSAQATGVYIAKVSIDGVEKSFKISK